MVTHTSSFRDVNHSGPLSSLPKLLCFKSSLKSVAHVPGFSPSKEFLRSEGGLGIFERQQIPFLSLTHTAPHLKAELQRANATVLANREAYTYMLQWWGHPKPECSTPETKHDCETRDDLGGSLVLRQRTSTKHMHYWPRFGARNFVED